MADLNEYFGLESDQDMAVVVNQENVGDMARLIDGKVYVHVDTVAQYIDDRYYWDATENLYLYALPKELVSVGVGSTVIPLQRQVRMKDMLFYARMAVMPMWRWISFRNIRILRISTGRNRTV